MGCIELTSRPPCPSYKHTLNLSWHDGHARRPGGLQHQQIPRYRRCPSVRESARAASLKVSCKAAALVAFRGGTAADAQLMRELVWKERMNPLGIAPERFTVAVDDSGKLLGFGQLEQKDTYKELRSMVVEPSCRRQGVGRALLGKLLEQAGDADVLLTTITSRMGFYAGAGFRRLTLKDIPRSLLFEVVAGTVVARLAAGEELVVMKKSS